MSDRRDQEDSGASSFSAAHLRGRVLPTVALYLGAAWVLLQVANTLEEALELPGWFDRTVSLVLIAGFPVAVVVALFRRAAPVPDAAASEGARQDARPSVAVLPFVNMSGDADHEYFADGMTEDVITGLSASRHIAVKSRTTAFAYKGQSPDPRQLARELGVEYVVEGSVRSIGDRVRITVKLIAAASADHLWAEKYDRPAAELFDIEDEVISKITGAVGATLAKSESLRAAGVHPQSLSAWQAVQRGAFYRGASGNSETETNESIGELRAATRDEPDYAYAHSMLAWMLLYRAVNGLSDDNRSDFEEARDHLARGLSLAPDDAFNLNICGGAYSYMGDADRGEELCLRALSIDPNYADANFNLALIYSQQGRHEEAHATLDIVERVAPNGPISRYYEWYRSGFFLRARDYAAAEPLVRTAIEKAPAYATPYVHLVGILLERGRDSEAEEVAARVLAINPKLRERRMLSFELGGFDPECVTRTMAMLREAD